MQICTLCTCVWKLSTYWNLKIDLFKFNFKTNLFLLRFQKLKFHDLSEIILDAQEIFLIVIIVQISCAAGIIINFFKIFDNHKSHKNSIYLNQFKMSECIYKVGFEPRPPSMQAN